MDLQMEDIKLRVEGDRAYLQVLSGKGKV